VEGNEGKVRQVMQYRGGGKQPWAAGNAEDLPVLTTACPATIGLSGGWRFVWLWGCVRTIPALPLVEIDGQRPARERLPIRQWTDGTRNTSCHWRKAWERR
jgi:hypothetical protein